MKNCFGPRALARSWNWKSALFSSGCRGPIFFFANIRSGAHAAAGAMLAEFAYRCVTAGFYGGITQAVSQAHPRKAAAATAGIVILSHAVEFTVHWLRGTPNLRISIVASACFTVVSTWFNLHAMRRGVLITGADSASFREDLRALPRILASFGSSLRDANQ